MQHKEFGGSTAERTQACPAWHTLAQTVPTPPGSAAANRGTALHEVMDRLLCELVTLAELPATPPVIDFDGTNYTVEIGDITYDATFVLGGTGKWKQRFMATIGQGEYILPIQVNEQRLDHPALELEERTDHHEQDHHQN